MDNKVEKMAGEIKQVANKYLFFSAAGTKCRHVPTSENCAHNQEFVHILYRSTIIHRQIVMIFTMHRHHMTFEQKDTSYEYPTRTHSPTVLLTPVTYDRVAICGANKGNSLSSKKINRDKTMIYPVGTQIIFVS
jgi:hypothetical protein